MLVSQATLAASLFTDAPVSAQKREEVYQSLLREKENIVLTGLPGSGKSTLGRELAKKLHLTFVDSDQVIEEREHKSISEIFATRGEAYFRDVETEVIKELSARQGLVIATGGGVPLKEENVAALKSNGKILFLDADPETLVGTPDRPLAQDGEAIRRLRKARHGTYLATADRVIPVTRNTKENIQHILKEIL